MEMLTMKEASKYLKVNTNILREWDKKGKLPAIKINDRGDRRYIREELDKFIINGYKNEKE